jgi:hypothetical protein
MHTQGMKVARMMVGAACDNTFQEGSGREWNPENRI